jgi:hypothetical protein
MMMARRADALRLRLEELARRREGAALGAYRRELVRQSREGQREERRVAREQAREDFRRMMLEEDEPIIVAEAPVRPMRPRAPTFG